jgi:hypothetical protein
MTVHLTIGLTDKAQALLILLVVGHFIADFLAQTPRVAERKEENTRHLLEHGLVTLVTHLVLLIPFMSWMVAVGVAALAIVHTIFDALRIRVAGAWGGTLGAFFLDQGLHLATVLVLFGILQSAGAQRNIVVPYASVWLPWVNQYGMILAGYAFNSRGGTAIVRKLLQEFPKVVPKPVEGEADEFAMGRTIGVLERFTVFTLVLLGQWGALGLVVAAKSIARFPELKDQNFSDYYLIGTLSSILVAVATGILVRAIGF